MDEGGPHAKVTSLVLPHVLFTYLSILNPHQKEARILSVKQVQIKQKSKFQDLSNGADTTVHVKRAYQLRVVVCNTAGTCMKRRKVWNVSMYINEVRYKCGICGRRVRFCWEAQ